MKLLFSLVALCCLGMFTVGCDMPDTPQEQAVENEGDRIEDATDDAAPAVENQGDAIENATDDGELNN